MNPVDIIEEMVTRDVVDLTWEILRSRRLKTCLIDAAMPDALASVLTQAGGDEQPDFMSDLEIFPKPASPEQTLAKKWARRDPAAIKRAEKQLTAANLTMESVRGKAFVNVFDSIERFDRLITIAEARRNSALRELDRHRATFASALRNRVQDIETAEFEVVGSNNEASETSEDKNAA